MTRYAAFLRGINVGQAKRISMPSLRATAEELGYTGVRSYINSGNLVFDTSDSAAAVEKALTAAIGKASGHRVDVTVRTAAQLRRILDANPYPDGEPSKVTVAFLTAAAPANAKTKVAEVATDAEPFRFAGREVWVHYGNGLGRSKLAEKFSAIVGVSSTVRNVNTIAKVLALCEQD